MNNIYTSTEMADLPPLAQCDKAIKHTLLTICGDRRKWELLGLGTQTFSLLTEAWATMRCGSVEEVRRKFIPANQPAEPESKGGRYICGKCKADFQLHFPPELLKDTYYRLRCPFCNEGWLNEY